MKVKGLSRAVLTVGWAFLMGVMVGSGGNTQTLPMSDLGSMAAKNVMETNEEGSAEALEIEEEGVLVEATRVTTTPSEPLGTGAEGVTLGNYPINISLDGIELSSRPDNNADEAKSVAYYFLRDRSRTVYEICGQGHYTSAMKDIPDFIFTLFKSTISKPKTGAMRSMPPGIQPTPTSSTRPSSRSLSLKLWLRSGRHRLSGSSW